MQRLGFWGQAYCSFEKGRRRGEDGEDDEAGEDGVVTMTTEGFKWLKDTKACSSVMRGSCACVSSGQSGA